MPRYMVELDYTAKRATQGVDAGSRFCRVETDHGIGSQVTWVHIYVSRDKKKSYCVYDAPSSEAIMRMAQQNDLPEPQVTEVMTPHCHF